MGCGGSVHSATVEKDLEYGPVAASNDESNDEEPGIPKKWEEVVKVDSQRSNQTTALCTPALEDHTDVVDSDLSADSFDPRTGVPDMDNSKLNANLRKFASIFDAGGAVPEDFPRLARLIIRKQTRQLVAQGLKMARCMSEETDEMMMLEKSGQLGTRRLTDPVIADVRFKDNKEPDGGIPSSQQLQAQFWRSWQAKESKLVQRRRISSGTEEDSNKIESAVSAPAIIHQKKVSDDMALDELAVQAKLTIEEEPEQAVDKVVEEDPQGFGEQSPSFDEALQASVQKALFGATEHQVPAEWSSNTSCNSVREWQQREHVLFILDWDDTILPTTWLTAKPWFRSWIREKGSLQSMVEIDPQDLEHLTVMDAAASDFLRSIKSLGTLVCITLSQRPWVEMSMKAFLPRLHELWEECGISVHYAVEEYVATPSRQGAWCQKPSGANGLEGTVLELHLRANRKRKVMERVLRRFYRRNNNRWLHAVSIGDGLAERDALQEISMCHQNPQDPESGESVKFRVKTIQMMEDPICDHIRTQLEVLKKWLPALVNVDQDVDAVLGF
mmetsp:Transcript_67881/g.159781  ORF Transcript_67881/g.159781 Transcript_67881/m.159781 type:complete len:557 (+) Transcript_67881:31-1701(+)